MMDISRITSVIKKNTRDHGPIVFSIAAGIGVLATAYLTGRASYQAADLMRISDAIEPPPKEPKERMKERVKLVWKLYIPAAGSAITTIVCIAGANRLEAKKTIAAQAAFALAERSYSEYRDKVIEQLGENRDESVRASIAEDRIKAKPPKEDDLLELDGPHTVLCQEGYTGRYFRSDMESLRRAENDINAKILIHDYATLNDFYYLIGLRPTTMSSDVGWHEGKQVRLEFASVLTERGVPVLTFEYNYITMV